MIAEIACVLVPSYAFVWDNTQIEIKAHHQSRKQHNRFRLWALMFAVKNRVHPSVSGSTKLW